MPAAATAVLEIIGIVLITHTGDHYRGIAPRILRPDAQIAIGNANPPAGIEPHIAFLAFPACAYVSSKGWPPAAMEPVNGVLWVRLDGEKITVSSAAAVRDSLTRTNPYALHLPHLGDSCVGATKLLDDFQPPDFPGAQAVIDLPASATVKACHSSKVDASRLDTEARIPNDGTITLRAVKNGQTKEIELTSTRFYFADLPASYVDPLHNRARTSAPHNLAYLQMIEKPKTGCHMTASLVVTRPEIPQCEEGEIFALPTGGSTSRSPETAMNEFRWHVFDALCANSQWP